MPRIPPRMTRNARDLRNHATDAERLIWARISRFRPRFTRQLTVGRYIVDLACRQAKLAVEFDGSQHMESESDAQRTAFLESLGWKVIRFWNSDVIANPDGAAESILTQVAAILGPTHPQPLPSREGRVRKPRSRPTTPA